MSYVSHESGNFYTTGAYSQIVNEYDIHGVSFTQRIDSVKDKLDYDTIEILKVLLQENEVGFDLKTNLELIAHLDFIQSRLSKDNKKSIIPTILSGDDL